MIRVSDDMREMLEQPGTKLVRYLTVHYDVLALSEEEIEALRARAELIAGEIDVSDDLYYDVVY